VQVDHVLIQYKHLMILIVKHINPLVDIMEPHVLILKQVVHYIQALLQMLVKKSL
jgi:hypothetical protein